MPLPPIVDRELRVAARRPATFRIRFFAAVAATLLGGLFLLTHFLTPGSSPSQGRSLFSFLVGLQFICALLAGPLLTADALGRERREGTLGFLFLAGLRGIDIVAGKLSALGLIPLHGLLAVFPIAALSVFMGGVTAPEFWRTTLIVLHTTFLSLAASIWISSRVSDERRAIGLALALVIALALLPEVTSLALHALPLNNLTGTTDLLHLASPYGLLTHTLPDSPRPASPLQFLAGLAAQNGLAWALLLASARNIDTRWRQSEPTTASRSASPIHRLASRLPFLQHIARTRTRHLHQAGPMALLAWRRSGVRGLIPATAFLTAAAAGLTFGIALRNHPPLVSGEMAARVLGLGFFILKFLLIAHTVHFLQDLCRSGAMELILTTPVSSRTLRDGHFAALWSMFTRPVLLLASVQMALGIASRLLAGGDWPSLGYLYAAGALPPLFGAFVHALDFIAIAYHATTWAFREDSPTKALVRSTLFALTLPTLLCGSARFVIDLILLGQLARGLDRFRDLALSWHFRSPAQRTSGAPRPSP